jgi:integrase
MKPLRIPKLALLGSDIDRHIVRLNKNLPGPITEIGRYIKGLSIQASSTNVYLSLFKKSLAQAMGDAYHFRSGVSYTVEQYFKTLRRVVVDSGKSRKIPWDDIAALMLRGGARTAILLEIFCRTGLRVTELCTARWDNLKRSDSGYELMVIGKRKKKRWIPFPPDLVARIEQVFRGRCYMIETSTHKPYDRKEIYHLFSHGARRHLGYAFGPHALRHTFASDVYDNWPNLLKALATHLGHKSVDMTMKYIHQNLEIQHLPAAPQASLFFESKNHQKPMRKPA